MPNYFLISIISFFVITSQLNAMVIHVSPSGNDDDGNGSETYPYLTIQKGIDASSDSDTVYVHNGVYEGGIVISNKYISLIGESREDTRINQPISSPQVSVIDSDEELIKIQNFRIKRGTSDNGGGIFCSESKIEVKNIDFSNNVSNNDGAAIKSIGSEIFIYNSTFTSNNSDARGCAIFVDPSTVCEIYNSSFLNNQAEWGGAIATVGGGKLLIDGCNISFNIASGLNPNPNEQYPTFGGGGGIYQEWSDDLEIYNSEIINNTATMGAGGGIAIYLSNNVRIDNIILSNNSSSSPDGYPSGGGGVAFYRADSVVFENSIISNNVSNNNSGGGIFLGSESGLASIVVHATFNKLTIVNNSAMSGGAIFCWSAILNLYSSTIAQNEASNSEWSGGGLASHYVTEPNIVNSLFYDNVPNSIHNGYQQTPILVSYSLVQEEWSGEQNLTGIDPEFSDPSNNDFSLQQSSPCIDVGTLDIDGDGFNDEVFYTGSAPDLGSHEWVIEAPQDLQSYPQDSSIMLTWSPITDAQYYQLDRANDISFTENLVQSYVTTNYFTDEDIEPEIEYFYRISGYVGYWTNYSNTVSIMTESLDIKNVSDLPNNFLIHQNFPNPFNPITTIRYELPEDSFVDVTVYDMIGNVVRNLINTNQSSGYKSIKWDATNNQGEPVSAGVYLYTVQTGDFVDTKKMILLK